MVLSRAAPPVHHGSRPCQIAHRTSRSLLLSLFPPGALRCLSDEFVCAMSIWRGREKHCDCRWSMAPVACRGWFVSMRSSTGGPRNSLRSAGCIRRNLQRAWRRHDGGCDGRSAAAQRGTTKQPHHQAIPPPNNLTVTKRHGAGGIHHQGKRTLTKELPETGDRPVTADLPTDARFAPSRRSPVECERGGSLLLPTRLLSPPPPRHRCCRLADMRRAVVGD